MRQENRPTVRQTDSQKERDKEREEMGGRGGGGGGGGTKNKTLGHTAEQGGTVRMTTLDKDGPRTWCTSVRFQGA